MFYLVIIFLFITFCIAFYQYRQNTYVIKIDIDGVLRDMDTPMLKLYNDKFNTALTKSDITEYDVNKSYPKLLEEQISPAQYFFETHAKETMLEALPYPDIQDGFKTLKKARENGERFKIKIVSYQPSKQGRIYTKQWLKNNNAFYDEIVFVKTPDKTNVEGDCLIDDCPKFLQEDISRNPTIKVQHHYNIKCPASATALSFSHAIDIVLDKFYYNKLDPQSMPRYYKYR